MDNFLLLIVSICASIWFFYKYKESQIRLKSVISKNLSLKLENNAMKTKMKYLETYKDDVSKTFKILDDELLLIKDNLTQPTQRQQNVPLQNTQVPRHRVSLLTPNLLTSLMSNQQSQPIQQPMQQPIQQSQDVFNNIFNRFLTSNITNNDIESLREQQNLLNQEYNNTQQETLQESLQETLQESLQESLQETLQETQQEIQQEIQQETQQEIQQEIQQKRRRHLESIKEEPEESNILCSPNSYTKYLMNN
jgi:DNA primase